MDRYWGSHQRTTHEGAIRKAVAEALKEFSRAVDLEPGRSTTFYGQQPIPFHLEIEVVLFGNEYACKINVCEVLDPATVVEQPAERD